jgi:hypothetical protein
MIATFPMFFASGRRLIFRATKHIRVICLFAIGLALVVLSLDAKSAPTSSNSSRPNTILVLADDLGCGDLDYLWRNESVVKLPNVISTDPALEHNVAEKKVQYSQDLFAEEALTFVRNHKAEPFFLYIAITIRHANDEVGEKGMEVPNYGEYASLDWPEPQKGRNQYVRRGVK